MPRVPSPHHIDASRCRHRLRQSVSRIGTPAVLLGLLPTARSVMPSPLKSPPPRQARWRRIGDLGLEGAIALAQQHRNRVVAKFGHREIGNTVAVEVSHGYALVIARRVGHLRLKVPLPLPSTIDRRFDTLSATARSMLPSRLKSAATTESGIGAEPITWLPKVPSPLQESARTQFRRRGWPRPGPGPRPR